MNGDRQEYIRQLFQDNGVVELRLLRPRPTSGLYDDPEAFLRDARLQWRNGHVYTSLNAPKPRKVSNRLGSDHALRDDQIGWITRLPFDFDPVRPSGVCSTNTELDAAYFARNRFIEFCSESDWPEPIRACSGNGSHAQFRTRLPNNHKTHNLLRQIYQKLAVVFTDPLVQFDSKVRNPSRVFRLYGSVNRKGYYSEDRPHRQSDVLMPQAFIEVTLELLNALDHRLRAITQGREWNDGIGTINPLILMGRGDYRTLDVVGWFQHHKRYKRAAHSRGKHYVTCPWLHAHSTPDSLEKTDTIIFEVDGGWPGFYCSHAHCEGRTIRDVLMLWSDADIFCSQAFMKATTHEVSNK